MLTRGIESFVLVGVALCSGVAAPGADALVPVSVLKGHVEQFNRWDDELYSQHFNNARAAEFLERNIPRFQCPDPELERTYYFRWWTFRKHLKQTPDGFVVTEFLPGVSWAGKHNTISCAAGHHFYEGRWLRERIYLEDYARFWFRRGGEPRRYSFWAADALWALHLAQTSRALVTGLLPELVANFKAWEQSNYDAPAGLFHQIDDRDGMEVSIGGSGYRVTINSYMAGDAAAIARIARLAGDDALAREFEQRSSKLRQAMLSKLWDDSAGFFKVAPRKAGQPLALSDARELHGFTPWYFHLAEPRHSVAWKQLIEPQGFRAAFGPTTAEQRHRKFALAYTGHECQWNGPGWPYSTAVTLTGLANLLNDDPNAPLSKSDYLEALSTYSRSHRLTRPDGTVVPWIDENLNPRTGEWLARSLLVKRGQSPRERGKDYNHSSFCDLVITGLAGLRPRPDNMVEVNPLVPQGGWEWFCLDAIPYHGRLLTILWDQTGERYGKGAGLRVFADGREIGRSARLERLLAPM